MPKGIVYPQKTGYPRRLDTPVRISERHRNELANFKQIWGVKSVDDVLEKLIAHHRPELVRILGIELPKEEK